MDTIGKYEGKEKWAPAEEKNKVEEGKCLENTLTGAEGFRNGKREREKKKLMLKVYR